MNKVLTLQTTTTSATINLPIKLLGNLSYRFCVLSRTQSFHLMGGVDATCHGNTLIVNATSNQW